MIKKSKNVIELKSFTHEKWYDIDLVQKTCNCPAIKTNNKCKHLEAVGLYSNKFYKHSATPTFSQALSGLVKSIRVRNPEEAVYWLYYLLGPRFDDPKQRFRIVRRLLIGSAEDGHSLPVMRKVQSNLSFLNKKDTPLIYFVAEVVRICKLPNWWNSDTGGHDYIYQNLVGMREWLYEGERTTDYVKSELIKAVEEKNKSRALGALMYFGNTKDPMGSSAQAEWVLDLCKKLNNDTSASLCEVHLNSRSALSGDNNFLSHAVWILAGGVSPFVDKIETVIAGECQELINKAKERWKNPKPIPEWCCDGLHCAGNDPRFAGMLPLMNAVCNAYKHYGRVNPDDPWLPEFLSLDGLVFRYPKNYD